MIPTVLPHEPRDANYRNGAHRGPAFLPWHREFLMQLEQELRTIEPTTFVPYWDWTRDAKLPDPSAAPIWADDFMGGNGLQSDEWRVQSGAFAHSAGNWPVPAYPEEDLRPWPEAAIWSDSAIASHRGRPQARDGRVLLRHAQLRSKPVYNWIQEPIRRVGHSTR